MSQIYDPTLYENPLLGAALIDPDLALSLVESLNPDDFALADHRAVWGALVKLARTPERMNIVDAAEQSGVDLSYLADLARNSYSTDPKVVGNWRDAIKRKSRLHRMQANFQALIEESTQTGADVDEIVRRAAGYIINLEGQRESQQKRSRKDVIRDRLHALSDRYEGLSDPVGIRTGIDDLDQMIFGLKPSELTLLAARPGMGKTALAMQIARLTACNAKKPAVVFSLEMDQDELFDRWLVQHASVDAGKYQRGKGMASHDLDTVGAAATVLSEAPLEAFDDIFDIEGIVAKTEALHRRYGQLGLIVVDYLQLIGSKGTKTANRAQEVGEYSRALKLLAMRMQCPVLALSQLNRGVEERAEKRPMMSDLRESGSLEQDANKIVMIYRDEVYHEHSQDQGIAELIVRKHRGGPTGVVRCLAEMSKFSFNNITSDRVRHQAQTAGVDAFA